MNIVIEVAAFFDWEQCPEAPGLTLGPDLRRDINGRLVRKVLKEKASHTTIAIPETQIAALLRPGEKIEDIFARTRIAAQCLTHVMPHHAEPRHFDAIHVEYEPQVERQLSAYFGLLAPATTKTERQG